MGHIFESSANNSMGEDASALGALIDRSVPGWRHMCQSTGRPLGCEDMMPLAESSSSVEAPTPRCHCGVRSPIRTAWKCDYPGRRNQHEMLLLSVIRSRAPGSLCRCHSQVAGNERGH
ncbi:hypothetical protein HN51_002439 [Arachis hypogaea]